MSKERPILFSGEMVRAILDGRKTQTRRIVKPQPDEMSAKNYYLGDWVAKSPHGRKGDKLWVRESFHIAKGAQRWKDGTTLYKADHGIDIGGSYVDCAIWKPSIHMPKWASRITLEITNVRVERLQDISEEDAKAELFDHVECSHEHAELLEKYKMEFPLLYKPTFAKLWEKINGPGSWEKNPFVWVIEFKKI